MFAKTCKTFLKIFLLLAVSFSFVTDVTAATLSISPTQVQTTVGQTIRFQVMVNTQSTAINAVDGIISYDPNTLEVTSVSRSGSALNIWIEEPNFSNATGKISFAGGVATPGYTGSGGLVFSITAKAKKTGSATFDLNNISIRKNDGEGTEVVNAAIDSVVTIGKSLAVEEKPVVVPKEPAKPVVKTEPEQPKVVAVVKLLKPELISSTHPDQEAWYNSKEVIIGWPKNINASGVQTVFDSKPDTVAYGPVQYGVNQKILKGVRDGISYLHVRYVSKNNISETAHYVVRIDSLPPSDISIQTKQDEEHVRVLEISATDLHAGVSFANISIDSSAFVKVPFENGKAVYSIPESYEGGKHSVVVEVYDGADNKASITQEIELKDIPKVQITVLNKTIRVGKSVQISGKTSTSNSEVTIIVKAPSQKVETYLVQSDTLGNIAFEIPLKKAGAYQIWASTGDSDVGDIEKVEVYKNWFDSVSEWMILNNWIYGLVFIVLAAIMLIIYIGSRFAHKLDTRMNDQGKLEKKLQVSGEILKEEAIKQVVYLEKLAEIRPLTKEEKNMYNLCQKILN